MAKLRRYESAGEVGWILWCPGCNMHHSIREQTAGKSGWTFNHDVDHPTFSPSLLVTGVETPTDEEVDRIMRGEKITPRPLRCHSFIRDGMIQFLGDCTHALKNQTVPLPDVDEVRAARTEIEKH